MRTQLTFVAIQNTILALRDADGSEVWRHSLGGLFTAQFACISLLGGRLLASCQGELTCLDPETGRELWKNPLKGLGTGLVMVAGCAGHPDRVFVGIQGSVLALRASDGSEVWRHAVGGALFTSSMTCVTCLNGRIYATGHGELLCLDPETGHEHWRNPLKGLGTGFAMVAGADPRGLGAAAEAAAAQASMAAAVAVMAVTASSGGGGGSC